MLLYLLGMGLVASAAVGAVVTPRRARALVSAVLGVAGCSMSAVAAWRVLRGGAAATLHSGAVLPFSGLYLRLDPLSALFVVLVAVVAVAVLVYNVGYARGATASRPAMALVAVFIVSLLAVPAAAGAATFMFLWELMAVSSTLLIAVPHAHEPDARSATVWYAAMTQAGAASILLGLLLVSAKGGASFADVHAHLAALSPALRGAAFVLTLVGFASKAGAVPLHVWLPKAHPAAPSPVSALMSGAMVAMGVYGIVRVGRDLLGPGALWWWLVVVALGAASALYGALHSTTSTDVKRLLAYSTIDVLGLVLVGVGCSGALATTGHAALSRLTLTGALLLLLAHAIYKGCLFLAAGAVERGAGTRDLDQLGGLVHRMPRTTAMFAVGALSLVAIPTLSGFSSEWVLLEGLLHGFADRDTATDVGLLFGISALALTGGLSAVAFVKALGIGFLGQARSAGARSAREVPATMTAAMGLLAAMCVVLGVVPGVVVAAVERAGALGRHGATLRSASVAGVALAHLRGAIEPMALLGALAVVGALAWSLARRGGLAPARAVSAWRGGEDEPSARMQYTATSFGEPLQRVFSDVLRPEVDVEVTHAVESRFYEQAVAYSTRVEDTAERFAYRPLVDASLAAGRRARGLMNGNVHRYLAFGFVALLIALVVVA